MKVKVGEVTIPEAQVKRYISLESSLPLSMIDITYSQEVDDEELVDAWKNHTPVPFECEILKAKRVLVRGLGRDEQERHFTFQEFAADVYAGYKSVDWTQPTDNKKMVFIVPDDVKDLIDPYELSLLPYKRLILRKDIPEEWFKTS